ncbi:MAG: hypothetical protein IJR68_03080, partial [Fretibacterium sp.]|nr:hypothetical protein [Fretibacterium sp.]
MKKFALFLLALCAALVPVGGLAVPCWAGSYTINSVEDITEGGGFTDDNGYYTLNDDFDVLTFNTDITGLTKGLRINKPVEETSTL